MKVLKNKVVLITGGTGSFGNTITKKFLNLSVKELRIFSRDEKKQDDMRRYFSDSRIKFFIGDIRDRDSLEEAVKGVDYIFHAAALKQVPTCEFYPMEAIKTNVIGVENLLSHAIKHKVKKVVILSTDKAVYPINAMGMSKAMMERVMIAKARMLGSKASTILCVTRYGNVMASRGSVIPLFIEKIKKKDSLPITNPSMTRFLMSLDDSVDLVLHAFEKGNQGDLFVQKSPASTVLDLAKALNNIFSSSSKIKIIGTRHGEKLYESLLSKEERNKATESKNYFCVPMDSRDLNYEKYFVEGEKDQSFIEDYNSNNTTRLDQKGVEKLLLTLPQIKGMLND